RQFLDFDLPETHGSVIALQEEGSRLGDVLVEFAACRFITHDIIVDELAVEANGDLITNDRRLDRLPFATRFIGPNVGCLEIVDGSIAGESWLALLEVAEDLD